MDMIASIATGTATTTTGTATINIITAITEPAADMPLQRKRPSGVALGGMEKFLSRF
jgi:hypothetical protein